MVKNSLHEAAPPTSPGRDLRGKRRRRPGHPRRTGLHRRAGRACPPASPDPARLPRQLDSRPVNFYANPLNVSYGTSKAAAWSLTNGVRLDGTYQPLPPYGRSREPDRLSGSGSPGIACGARLETLMADSHSRLSTGIRTDQRLRVFVSSTLGELDAERRAARAAVEQLRLAPVMFESGAHAEPAQAMYRACLEQSDVFVGIDWRRCQLRPGPKGEI
jgi:Domain of unknown function (DUF4062)